MCTSLESVAAAARMTKGAVYHHFGSKEALFEQLVRSSLAGRPSLRRGFARIVARRRLGQFDQARQETRQRLAPASWRYHQPASPPPRRLDQVRLVRAQVPPTHGEPVGKAGRQQT